MSLNYQCISEFGYAIFGYAISGYAVTYSKTGYEITGYAVTRDMVPLVYIGFIEVLY